jgi:hypothetical protein
VDLPTKKPKEWLQILRNLARSGLTPAEAFSPDALTVDEAEGDRRPKAGSSSSPIV